MTDHIWHDWRNPPDSDRRIILRFGPSGIHDVIGRYDAGLGAYYVEWNAARRGEVVHPKCWRELEDWETFSMGDLDRPNRSEQ